MRDAVRDALGAKSLLVQTIQSVESISWPDALSGDAGALGGSTPFLSVIIRTQGRRPVELSEVLLCLAGQTTEDFEVILVGHNLTDEGVASVRTTIDSAAPWLLQRIRFITSDGGTRAQPLNAGFEVARGRYCAVLDDDDLTFAHWVETFKACEQEAAGRIIRARSVWQDHRVTRTHGVTSTSPAGEAHLLYNENFSLLRHVYGNETPFMSVAFPRVLHASGLLRFDSELSTLEDWDYLIHAASLVGVLDVAEITSVYRRWVNSEHSGTAHSDQEWYDNLTRFEAKIDSRSMILAPGETAVLRELLESEGEDRAGVARGRTDTETLRLEALALLDSRSWRFTAPVRALGRALGRGKPVTRTEVLAADRSQLLTGISAIRTSRSWYVARALRPSADRL